jgi:hypothetical protein
MRIVAAARPLFVALVLLHGSALYAQQPGPAAAPGETSAMTEKARELYNQGLTALNKGHVAEAHASFLAAWSLKKHSQIAGNLGAAEMQLGRYREAAEHLSYYLREAPKTKEKERQSALSLLTEARKHVGSIRITVEPAGADVFVDGAPVGKAPLEHEVFVDPGKRTVEARLDGYTSAKEVIATPAGAWHDVPLRLVKIEPRGNVATGAGVAAPNGSAIPRFGAEAESRERGPSKGVIIGGIAASAVAVSGGVVFAILSSVNAGDAADRRTTLLQDNGGKNPCLTSPLPMGCREFESSLTAKDTFGNLSVFSFVLGGMLGAGTAIYAVGTPKPKPSGVVQVVPVSSAEGAGLMLHGRW